MGYFNLTNESTKKQYFLTLIYFNIMSKSLIRGVPQESQPSNVSDYDSVAVLLLFVQFHVFGGFVLVSESEEDGGC